MNNTIFITKLIVNNLETPSPEPETSFKPNAKSKYYYKISVMRARRYLNVETVVAVTAFSARLFHKLTIRLAK